MAVVTSIAATTQTDLSETAGTPETDPTAGTPRAQTPPAEVPADPADAAVDKPLRKDAALNRERILTAAAEVFAERGLDVSLDDIARHAGLGVGTVYRRFPSKDLLVEALFEQHMEALTTLAESGAEAEDSWEGLVKVITEICSMQATNRGLSEILLSSRFGQGCADRARERLNPAIAKRLERARADGYLRADVVPVDVVIAEFMIGGVAQYTRHVPGAWRRYLEIFIDGLRARPDAGPLSTPPLTSDGLDEAMTCWHPAQRR
jgi:AcrR family transcriptional regulator